MITIILLALVLFLATLVGGRSVANAQVDECLTDETCVPIEEYDALMRDFEQVNHRAIILESRVRQQRAKIFALRHTVRILHKRLRWNSRASIRFVFGPYAGQALSVAYCESRWSTSARNGQYLGLFQMGSYARARYGHGADALTQSRAAHRYFVASGRDWSPWACKP